MAAIAPGLSGTFKQRTIEGRLLESLLFVVLSESNERTNPENLTTVRGSFDSEKMLFVGSYAIPTIESSDKEGNLVLKAKNHLQGLSIDPGLDNPTFRSTRPEAYVLEVLKRVQDWERNPGKNPRMSKNVTGNYDSDLQLYSGTFAIPVQMGLSSDGTISIFAVEYLET